MSKSVLASALKPVRVADWVPKLLGIACLGVGLWIVFGTLFYLDEHFANHLNSWLPEHVFTRFCISMILVGFGLRSLWHGSRSAADHKGRKLIRSQVPR